MKILQIIPHYLPATGFGGPQRVAHSLGTALIRAGHKVTVCTTNLANEYEILRVPQDEPVYIDGVQVFYEPVTIPRYWGFSPLLYRRIREEVWTSDLVVVHSHYQFANWIGAALAREAGAPYVIFAHASLHKMGIRHKSRWVKLAYLALLERRNLSNALFVAFNAVEEQTYSLHSENSRVIPSGVDLSEYSGLEDSAGSFRLAYPQLRNKLCFLFLGRLDVKHKGLDLLLPAFARLRSVDEDTFLVLVGPNEGSGVDEIMQMAKSLKIEDSILLPGLLEGPTRLAALQDADVFVLPSRFEGLSIALLEALYIGLPVLVTNQVGLCRDIEDLGAGVVVTPEQGSIFEGLQRMLDYSSRKSMRDRARQLIVEHFNWDAIAQEFMAQVAEAELLRHGKDLRLSVAAKP